MGDDGGGGGGKNCLKLRDVIYGRPLMRVSHWEMKLTEQSGVIRIANVDK